MVAEATTRFRKRAKRQEQAARAACAPPRRNSTRNRRFFATPATAKPATGYCFAPNDGETGGPKECGSADNSDAAKGLVVDAVVAVVAAVSIYAVALF